MGPWKTANQPAASWGHPPNILPIEKAVPGTIRWVLYEAWRDGRAVCFENRTIQA